MLLLLLLLAPATSRSSSNCSCTYPACFVCCLPCGRLQCRTAAISSTRLLLLLLCQLRWWYGEVWYAAADVATCLQQLQQLQVEVAAAYHNLQKHSMYEH
jgi:hypothetical protein